MSEERQGQLVRLRPRRTLTIDRATALASLGAIYAFGVPDLDSRPSGSGAGPAPDRRRADDPA